MRLGAGRAWKLVLVIAAAITTASFFLPFIEVNFAGRPVPVSAYRIVVGFSDVQELDPTLGNLPPEAAQSVLGDWNHTISVEQRIRFESDPRSTYEVSNYIPYYFASAALLIAVSVIACVRRRLGFFGGLAGIAAGLVAIWGWSREVLMERHDLARGALSWHVASPAKLLAIGGTIALVASIASLIIADPGGFRAVRKIGARLQLGERSVLLDVGATDQRSIPSAVLRPRRGKRVD